MSTKETITKEAKKHLLHSLDCIEKLEQYDSVINHLPIEYIRVFPEYNKASDNDKLLCLNNIESWILGEKIKIVEKKINI